MEQLQEKSCNQLCVFLLLQPSKYVIKTFRYVTLGYSAAVLILMCFDINMCLLAPISHRPTTQQNSGKIYCTYLVKSDCVDIFWILS